MTVKELIEKLTTYNMDAEVSVIAHNKPHDFSLTYGGAEGCDKKTAPRVSFYVDDLCTIEAKG